MHRLLLCFVALASLFTTAVHAQDLTVTTVTREPFSMEIDGKQAGFSMDLGRRSPVILVVDS